MSRQANKSRQLFIATAIAVLIWLASIVLFNHHYTNNPYSWLDPAHEGDRQRGLWLLLRNIYIGVGIASFITAIAFALVGFILMRRRLP